MPTPSLIPLPPLTGDPVSVGDRAEISIGPEPAGQTGLNPPSIDVHRAELQRRDTGWWILPGHAPVKLNGKPVGEPLRLRDRDQIEVAPGHAYEFASGEKRTRRMESMADMVVHPRKRRNRRLPGPARNVSVAALATVVIAVLLVAGAAAGVWYGTFRATKSIVVLNDRQATELDSLLIVAYDHVERGGTLLELGLGDGALDEFARAVNTLALSDLRNHPQVKPRIEALEASVASIYRERSLKVPENYANATSPLTADQLKTASLSVTQFAAQFALMAAAFQSRFGHEIVVSGRDHAEHVALYGKGGAMDLSIKTMKSNEVGFIIDQGHARHIRVKDFSQDSVLRREVQAAVKAGLLFEAGTGLHLHIDRFANRRDRWTTLLTAPSRETAHQLVERGPLPGITAERRRQAF